MKKGMLCWLVFRLRVAMKVAGCCRTAAPVLHLRRAPRAMCSPGYARNARCPENGGWQSEHQRRFSWFQGYQLVDRPAWDDLEIFADSFEVVIAVCVCQEKIAMRLVRSNNFVLRRGLG